MVYRSLKRETRRAWREELVSWALVGDVLLSGLDERLNTFKGLGERLLTNLRGGNQHGNYRYSALRKHSQLLNIFNDFSYNHEFKFMALRFNVID